MLFFEVYNNKKEKSEEKMIGCSFVTDQDLYYDGIMGSDMGYGMDNWDVVNEGKSYKEFINDTSDDAYIWLKQFGNDNSVLVG